MTPPPYHPKRLQPRLQPPTPEEDRALTFLIILSLLVFIGMGAHALMTGSV